MNVHTTRPDRSPEAVAKRKYAADQARAANRRQVMCTTLCWKRRQRLTSPAILHAPSIISALCASQSR